MKKLIKLTEKDLRNVIKRVISEQDGNPDMGVPPFPKPKDTGEVGQIKHKPEGGLELGPPPPVAKAKEAVKLNLVRAKQSLTMLKNLSGVNTDMCDDIDKIIEKFENLFGEPKEKVPTEK